MSVFLTSAAASARQSTQSMETKYSLNFKYQHTSFFGLVFLIYKFHKEKNAQRLYWETNQGVLSRKILLQGRKLSEMVF